jgi:hypothetical protein
MKAIERAPRQQQAIDKELKKARDYFTRTKRNQSIANKMRSKRIYEPQPIEEDDIKENVAATMQAHASACNAFESHKEITMLYDQSASEMLDYALSCIERLTKLSATEAELAPIWAEFEKHQLMLAH